MRGKDGGPVTIDDQERIRRATQSGSRMLGPKERQRCAKHPKRWEIYRWVWTVPDDGDHLTAIQSDSDTEVLRSCAECIEEPEDT
jgi:hypothetical protein